MMAKGLILLSSINTSINNIAVIDELYRMKLPQCNLRCVARTNQCKILKEDYSFKEKSISERNEIPWMIFDYVYYVIESMPGDVKNLNISINLEGKKLNISLKSAEEILSFKKELESFLDL